MAEPGTTQTAHGPAPEAAAAAAAETAATPAAANVGAGGEAALNAAAVGPAGGNTGAAGRPAFDLQRFQQEVAAEIGIDVRQAAQRYPYVRELEPATHSDRQRGGQAGGQ